MLASWLKSREAEENRPSDEEALDALLSIVEATPEQDRPALLTELCADRYRVLMTTPLHDQDATLKLTRLIDLLNPDEAASKILVRLFPVSWAMSVWGGAPFDARVLLNGVVLVRNHHRVLGPNLSEGQICDMGEIGETLTEDMATLRSRNQDENASCFLLTHDDRGVRLLSSDETPDLAAPGWGQTIAVCMLNEDDLKEDRLKTEVLREVGSGARAGVVFLRFFGDRVDLIPAVRFDDDLDVFLEEMAFGGFYENLTDGVEGPPPAEGEDLKSAVLERMDYETEHLPEEGVGAAWMRAHALPALAANLASTMTWGIVNFGFAPSPEGPRRASRLPASIPEALASDPDLMRRSVTLTITAYQERTCDRILEEDVSGLIGEAFEEVSGDTFEMEISGRIDRDEEDPAPSLASTEEVTAQFKAAMEDLREEAEETGEDLDELITNVSLGLTLLIDFPADRPEPLTIAAMARRLSGDIGGTICLYFNGTGEYLAYCDEEVDSGDHELFQLPEVEPDWDDEDED